MNPKVKLGLYAILMIAAAVFAGLFYSSYKSSNRESETPNISPAALANEIDPAQAPSTNAQLQTNVTALTNPPPPETGTNVPTTNAVIEPNVVTQARDSADSLQIARPAAKGRSRMIGYFAAFLGVAVFLGLLVARDISEYFGNRSVEFLFNDEGIGTKNPEYEQAEQEWANGHHLDAIRMMRDYLQRNPREQYVALRIAEIYEKDLKNNLAAALEYEEILKHKLPPQRWGWAAIHLCNLYSKLHKTDESVALLRRVVDEYGETPAADKARKRLAMFETVGEDALDADLPDSIESLPPKPTSKPIKVELEPPSNLPPGFRPKK